VKEIKIPKESLKERAKKLGIPLTITRKGKKCKLITISHLKDDDIIEASYLKPSKRKL